jgi:membrane associated rhomboid family serine protease
MLLFRLLPYISLLFSLNSLTQVFPFQRRNAIQNYMKIFLSGINLIIVFIIDFIPDSLIVILFIVTMIYTVSDRVLFAYIFNNVKVVHRRCSWLVHLGYYIMVSGSAKLLVILFSDDQEKGQKILSLLKKYDGDWQLVGNALHFAAGLGEHEIRAAIYHEYMPDLTKPNAHSYTVYQCFLFEIEQGNYREAERYLQYFDKTYKQLQFRSLSILIWLKYYHFGGNDLLFNEYCNNLPQSVRRSDIESIRKIERGEIPINDSPILYSKLKKEALSPYSVSKRFLYSIAFALSAISLVVMVFSSGKYSITQKLFEGPQYLLDYIRAGAYFRDFVNLGEWYRIITVVFLHAGIIHLFLNMYALIYLGSFLLRFYSREVLFTLFFVSVISGTVLSHIFTESLIMVGASGGTFGLLGAVLVVMITTRKQQTPGIFRRFLVSFAIILGVNILIGLQNSNIGNFAHLGGFISGISLGTLFAMLKQAGREKLSSTISRACVGGLAAFLTVACLRVLDREHDLSDLSYSSRNESYSIQLPERWIYSEDRFYDIINGAQIVIRTETPHLTNRIEEVIESYSEDYEIPDRSTLEAAVPYLSFSPKNNDTLPLIYFLSFIDSEVYQIYVFVEVNYQQEYISVIQKMFD